MKVSELIALLEELPQDATVIISKDGGGNRFSPFAGESIGRYIAETTWCGDYYGAQDVEDGHCEEEAGELCVVLWPTH